MQMRGPCNDHPVRPPGAVAKRVGTIVSIAALPVAAFLVVRFFGRIDLGVFEGLPPAFFVRRILCLVLFQVAIISLHSLQWGMLLAAAGIRTRVWPLLGARFAGAAVSFLSPALSVGGDLVRAALLEVPHADSGRLYATVAIDKYVELATRLPIVAAGLGVLLLRMGHGSMVLVAPLLAFALLVLLGGAGLSALLRRGPRTAAMTDRALKMLGRVLPRLAGRLRHGGGRLAAWPLLQSPARLIPVFAVGILAAGTELFQIECLLGGLGFGGAAGAAAMLAASVLGGILSIAPGGAGSQEAAGVLTCTLLGGGAATGVVYSLLMRAGQAAVVLLGLGYLVYRRLRRGRLRRGGCIGSAEPTAPAGPRGRSLEEEAAAPQAEQPGRAASGSRLRLT